MTLDLKSGYWQVEIDSADKDKTAFTTGCRNYQFKVMIFGFCNAPAIIERLYCVHLKNLQEDFNRLQTANLMLSSKECFFFKKKIEFLAT